MNYTASTRPGTVVTLHRLEAAATEWLAQHSVRLLQLSLGLVFLGFGVLKFFPGLSPAEQIAGDTMDLLTFGLLPGRSGLLLVALLETAIGLSLVTGRMLRAGVLLLGIAMVGILSPVVLLTGDLFHPETFTPNLTGQYVLKDIVLLSAGLVVAAKALLRRSPR